MVNRLKSSLKISAALMALMHRLLTHHERQRCVELAEPSFLDGIMYSLIFEIDITTSFTAPDEVIDKHFLVSRVNTTLFQ
jgi:hypothetical protein